ncbi:HAD-IIIC family phosphatase [Bradyrhizobium sp. USDA 4486]
MNLRNIKLIIWDLDETLWQGSLSEEGVHAIEDNIKLVIDLSKRGIVNSICSKNDLEPAMRKLADHGLSDYFVFCSIDWTPKGERIKMIVDNMGLRYENVLFVDDNISNLKEAEFYCSGLMTGLPSIITDLRDNVSRLGKDDSALERLRQYQQLEDKHVKKAAYSSNEEFLFDSAIRVNICRDVIRNEKRLYELIMRTNQLNFTKKRETLEDFQRLLRSADVDSGYVTVIDKYGDYGIVGFFAVENDALVHFAFSCRTIGMGIEQFVYDELNCPSIEIAGPVSATILRGERPGWINHEKGATEERDQSDAIDIRVLFKGPCDLQSIVQLMNVDNIDTELVHVDDKGRQIEIQCATQNVVNSCTLTKRDLGYLRDVMPFFEDEVFDTAIFDSKYNVVVISLLADFNFGVYEHRTKKLRIALGQNYKDITDPKNWQDYIDGRIYNGNYDLTVGQLSRFAEDFAKIDYGIDDIIDNVRFIRSRMRPHAKLVILLGSEREIEKYNVGNYLGRAKAHKVTNEALKDRFKDDKSIIFIEPSKYIYGEDDYVDHINHYSKRVMFNLAKEISGTLNNFGVTARTRSWAEVIANKILKKVRSNLPWLSQAN